MHFALLLAAAATKQRCVRLPAAGSSSKLDKEKKKTSHLSGECFLQLHLQDLNSSHAAEPLKESVRPRVITGGKCRFGLTWVFLGKVCGCEQGVTHFYSPPSTFKNLSRQEPAAQLWLSHRTAWIQTRRTWSWERDSWWKGWDIYVK